MPYWKSPKWPAGSLIGRSISAGGGAGAHHDPADRGLLQGLPSVNAFIAAGAGFLVAVLWFDLMFDVQARAGGAVLPEGVLSSIGAYYARVTTASRPMNRLVAAVMLATTAATVAQVARRESPEWAAWAS